MGRTEAYLQVERREHGVRPAREAVADYGEFALPLSADEQREQASRCMNCGVAFCQSGGILDDIVAATGCPLHNLIPEVNDLLYPWTTRRCVRTPAVDQSLPGIHRPRVSGAVRGRMQPRLA